MFSNGRSLRKLALVPALGIMVALGGCNTPEGDRALGGAAIGGLGGAAIGGLATGRASGALAGGAIGAAGGAIVGAATTPRERVYSERVYSRRASRCYVDEYGDRYCN